MLQEWLNIVDSNIEAKVAWVQQNLRDEVSRTIRQMQDEIKMTQGTPTSNYIWASEAPKSNTILGGGCLGPELELDMVGWGEEF